MSSVGGRSLAQYAWDTDVITATEAMAATGLSRSTVIAQCEDLVARGWLERREDARQAGAGYRAGRPALRFALRAEAGRLLGIDAGRHRLRALVTDLRGQELVRREVDLGGDGFDAERRRTHIQELIADLSLDVEAHGPVQAVVVGVPAPVGAQGRTAQGVNPFWDVMNPDLIDHLGAGVVAVENDAALAAWGEHWLGAARDVSSSVTLLAGERLGAGIIVDDRLMRGAHGAAGEMHGLQYVTGVGNAHGLAAMAREIWQEARTAGRIPASSVLAVAADAEVTAEALFEAARSGDAYAGQIVAEIAERLARIVIVLAGVIDVERVVLSGALAPRLDHVVELATAAFTERIPAFAPELVTSSFAGDSVVWGAIAHARGLLIEAIDAGA